jgi:hypothetical protein
MGIPNVNVSQAPPTGDQANAVVSGSFTGTGTSALFMPWGTFNLAIYGSGGPNGNWHATVQLERSFDGGTTWIVCQDGSTASGQAIYSTQNTDVSRVGGESERCVLYRLDCTAYTSGTVNYRMSQTGGAPITWTPNGAP